MLLLSLLQRSLEEQLLQVLLCTILVSITVTILLHAAVMQELPPPSRIYLLGETKTFTCQGTGNPASLLINSHNPVGDNTVTENLKSNNITWTKTPQGEGINTVTTFTVTMVMTVDNNGTKIWCGFNYGGPLYVTRTTVISVAGKDNYKLQCLCILLMLFINI